MDEGDIVFDFQPPPWATPTPMSAPVGYVPPVDPDTLDSDPMLIEMVEVGVSYYQFYNEDGGIDFIITILIVVILIMAFSLWRRILRRI